MVLPWMDFRLRAQPGIRILPLISILCNLLICEVGFFRSVMGFDMALVDSRILQNYEAEQWKLLCFYILRGA
jgi:hypothetical protein